MAYLRVLTYDLDDPLFLRLFETLALTAKQEIELIHVLKRIATPMETLIAQGRAKEAMSKLEGRQQQQHQQRQQHQQHEERQQQRMPSDVGEPGRRIRGDGPTASPSPLPSLPFLLTADPPPFNVSDTLNRTTITGTKTLQERGGHPRRVLVTVSTGTQSVGTGDVRFFYSSLLAVPEEEEALKEEVKKAVRIRVLGIEGKEGKGGGGEGEGDKEEEGREGGMSTTINFAPPKSLRKTVLKLTEKMATLCEEGEGGRGEGESFDVLVNVVMNASLPRPSLPSFSSSPLTKRMEAAGTHNPS